MLFSAAYGHLISAFRSAAPGVRSRLRLCGIWAASTVCAPLAKAQGEVASYSVYFHTGSAQLSAVARETLDSLIYAGAINRSQTLSVIGHASEPGDIRLNDTLSRKRAQAVADYLLRETF